MNRVSVNGERLDSTSGPFRYPLPRKGLRQFRRFPLALSVCIHDVRGATVTQKVALERRMKASRSLALSR